MARRSKLRVTGFTRFLLVMIIVVPLAYLGAAWYNGEDGVANIKSWFGQDEGVEQVDDTSSNQTPNRNNDASLQRELDYFKKRVDELEADNKKLQQQVWELKQEVSKLRQ
ncbi:MAG: hypothetical protein GYB31_14955 [Bacteroidetes bacterium]|nr:hypothetical protein [Bacteroidota bacterium]